MATILVVSEIRNGQLKKVNFEAYSAARQLADQLNGDVATVLIGSSVSGLSDIPGKYGVNKVLQVEDASLEKFSPDAYAAVAAEAARHLNADFVFMPATAMGKDLLPRVATLLNASTAQDVIHMRVEDSGVVYTRPMFAGKILADVKLTSTPQTATLRPKAFAIQENPVTAATEALSVNVPQAKAVVEEVTTSGGGKLDVTEADVVVSGGRGMKGPENWHLLEELAELLGGATGASRAVVDAGWRPHGEQVGQTGKTVSPTLYIAVGISGAIQHLAGMLSSKYIVAINKDPDAPIFKVADYGIVGDAMEVLPRLIEEIKKLKAES